MATWATRIVTVTTPEGERFSGEVLYRDSSATIDCDGIAYSRDLAEIEAALDGSVSTPRGGKVSCETDGGAYLGAFF